jgi:hypothetical protein
MSANRYTALGYVVWKGGKWYLRRRLSLARSPPGPRRLALAGAVALLALGGGLLLARRLSG